MQESSSGFPDWVDRSIRLLRALIERCGQTLLAGARKGFRPVQNRQTPPQQAGVGSGGPAGIRTLDTISGILP